VLAGDPIRGGLQAQLAVARPGAAATGFEVASLCCCKFAAAQVPVRCGF
jgi:hypothetical protein